ncbi:complement component C8 beta chain [Protopterus annectens]|uniref:complement component C8 beta chain n=1 Tax=Protopterus annectens TaxID=7888 RepID=UPI001CF9AF4A|nr:complement component C8 beta chain [Protopterus annectens]
MAKAYIFFFLNFKYFLFCITLTCLGTSCSCNQDLVQHLKLNSTGEQKQRWIRSVLDPPEPIDCVLSRWSQWSSCDPCQKKRFRYATLERPSQFGGEPCDTNDREEEACISSAVCRNEKRCEGFTCAETGRCIPRRLMCNGDDDCGDMSDEKNCKRVYPTCTRQMEEYWAIERLASGLNVMTNTLEGTVLDHRYYSGACAPHYVMDSPFRKPYNVESYTFETKGKYEFALDEYESYSRFEKETLTARASQKSVKIGFGIPGLFSFGFNYGDKKYKKFVNKIRRYSDNKSKFVRAKSNLEVVKYKLKDRNLMLHYEFFQKVKALPLDYSYGEYREIYRDYGTHYITEAILGGTYEYVSVMNSQKLDEQGYSLSDVSKCFAAGMKISVTIEGVTGSLGMSGGRCDGLLNEIGGQSETRELVEDFVVLVRGGESEHVASLAYKQLPTADLMQEWGDAVLYNPEIVTLKIAPLFELVTSTTFANANIIRSNLIRALEEFETETSSCLCAPCRNNGIAVMKGTRCYCECPVGFSGAACESTTRRGVIISGGWSCWSPWSQCINGQKSRRRQCNNPPPQDGGNECSGPAEETVTC